MKKRVLFLVCAILIFSLCSCSESIEELKNIDEPQKTATSDEIELKRKEDAVEVSPNVNGKRYNMTLEEFTGRYNEITLSTEGTEYLNFDNWQKQGEVQNDINGVEYQYYYYDADKIEFTATVETNSEKLMNVGCGTTASTFVSYRGEEKYSDIVLRKSAVMAAAVCGYTGDEVNLFQDIFYSITYKETDSLLFDSNVFSFSTIKNSDKEKSTLLYRCFPVSEYNAEEWDIEEYADK